MSLAGALRGGRASAATLFAIRRIIPVGDALVPRRRHFIGPAVRLRNPSLAELLGNRELGGWSLSPGTIDFLEQVILEQRPELVLEFGSGVSTACLAWLQRQARGDSGRPLVVSLEEDDEHARETTTQLQELGLSASVTVLTAPLVDQVVEGSVERCYSLPTDKLSEAFGSRRAELVLVDGPSLGAGGSRFATVPLARDLIAETAVIFLDDARRDAELQVARRWQRLPWLEICGVHLVGKGLLEARIRPSARRSRDRVSFRRAGHPQR